MHVFLLLSVYFNNHPPHVSNRFTIYHQEVFFCMQHIVCVMHLR